MSKFDRRAAPYRRNVVELAILLSGAQVRLRRMKQDQALEPHNKKVHRANLPLEVGAPTAESFVRPARPQDTSSPTTTISRAL
ncbi:hypothetical protein HX862_30725 [Pseudomonas sp. D5002]|uniref:hypothetical protein n=1 Tax=Pseudomonas sp. D5002 TaxID=2738818 RepID=UPI00070499C8|nr:hypothetical protein [Pseudomonas sp. D5002]KRP53534.1 hypothetical protein TU77_15815 [Pseudomonas synxantha]NWB12312.1 hypothetical protein [Pseudomonas sp. D5002]